MHMLHIIFIHFRLFPVVDSGLAHYASEPFNYTLKPLCLGERQLKGKEGTKQQHSNCTAALSDPHLHSAARVDYYSAQYSFCSKL